MFSTGSITSFETIISKLDAAIDKVYLEETNFNASVGTGSSGGGSRGGGFGGASTTVPNENPPSETKTLNDIKDHWAESYINNLVKKGGISGYEDGSFKPDNTITRAEFTKIIVGVFEISGDTETKYSDVSDDTWYSEYVKKASASGIINGSDGMFLPNNNITRQDAALIIYRVLKLKNIEMNSGKSFSDDSEISEYAKDAVSKMAVIGVINGYDGKFMPKNNITRAEAVTMIARALDLA